MTLLWRKAAGLGGRSLVILNTFRETEALRPYLPADATVAAVLVTTRRHGLMEDEVVLRSFTAKESLALLNNGKRKHTMEEAAGLIEALGGMALALELARGVLEAQPSLTVESLAEKLSGASLGWAEFQKYRDPLPSGNAKNVAAILRLSWNAIAGKLQAMCCRQCRCWRRSLSR